VNKINTIIASTVVALPLMAFASADTPYQDAAKEVKKEILTPYKAVKDPAEQSAILARMVFSCNENMTDPMGNKVQFPFTLSSAVTWHRYNCTFTLADVSGKVIFNSPVYKINQLNVTYNGNNIEPAVAYQNYNMGSEAKPNYLWMGKYVQPLNLMLRDQSGAVAADSKAIAGVNGGYDYRVDAWERDFPHDNICYPRYSEALDKIKFFTHPNPKKCAMGDNSMPSCAKPGEPLPITDDMGDSLVYLASDQRNKNTWRAPETPFQSYNCGGRTEDIDRGAIIFYGDMLNAKRTSPSKDNVTELATGTEPASAALGAGPLLIQNYHFVYDQANAEEGMGLDNYEIGGATGVGYTGTPGNDYTAYIVNVDGHDNQAGMHNWILGLYFQDYLHAKGAVALGNGGDATMWINPNTPTVQAVLKDTTNSNYAFFEANFVKGSHNGVVSNCTYTNGAANCSARPVHDGLFVYNK
tara:strand:+ start:18421 stop:19824 length:1404 start_codon:yes stop_codon:yes gene_type:complete